MVQWHIGCSGFHYKHWKGLFYPDDLPQKSWFDYYCRYFGTLELNVTFYRFPRLSFLETWYDKTPPDFRFAVKAPKAITHFKKFKGTVDMLADFYSTIRQGLKEKLGCVLFQLPPNYHYDAGKLEKIINSLDNSFLNVAEFRHASWWNEEVYKELATHNISFCGMSHPTLPDDVITNTEHLYFRFHGKTQLYTSRYPVEELKEFAGKVSAKKVKHAFIYFNNDVHAHAVENAKELINIINELSYGT